jgi:Putative addiction module component
MSLPEIIQQASQLNREERLVLRNVLDELESPTDPEFDRHWLEVVNDRRQKLQSGQTQAISLEDVLRELDDQI